MSDYLDTSFDLDNYSLESILAEYKGDAFIDSARKTSSDILDEQIQRILAEGKDMNVGDSFEQLSVPAVRDEEVPETESSFEPLSFNYVSSEPAEEKGTIESFTLVSPVESTESINVQPETSPADLFGEKTEEMDEDLDSPFFSLFRFGRKKGKEQILEESINPVKDTQSSELHECELTESVSQEDAQAPSGDNESGQPFSFGVFVSDDQPETPALSGMDNDQAPEESNFNNSDTENGTNTEILFFDDYRYASSDEGKEFETTWQETYEDTTSLGNSLPDEDKHSSILDSLKGVLAKQKEKREAAQDLPDYHEEEYIAEPAFSVRAEEFASRRHSLMIRSRISLLLSIILLLITLFFERGISLPGIGRNGFVLTAVCTGFLLVIMALSVDILLKGLHDMIRLQPGAESLLLLSSAVVLLSCFTVLLQRNFAASAPFCTVTAFALSLSQWGEYRLFAAMNLSLKTASTSETPDVYTSAYHKEIESSLIQHYVQTPAGFYNNLTEADISEYQYHAMTPVLILLSVVLALAGSIGSECSFLRAFAAILSAGAAFSMLSAYAIPFSVIAKRLRRSGSAVAGWGGADTIYYADGVRLCEEDLFPAGAAVKGVKIFDNREAHKIIRYTGSLLQAAQSGISDAFSAFMDNQGISHMVIDSFEVCEGGYSAYVRDENILIGTAACLNLYGIRIPEELNLKNAMYVSLNGELSGVFMIHYKPTKNVQNAMLAMLHGHLKLFAAGRDFNISPMMIQQKLQIPSDDIEPLLFKDSYAISENIPEKVPHAVAVSVHSTPGSLAETLVSARRLRVIARINTLFSLLTGILGMLLMFIMCRSGTASSVSPTSLCEFMLAMELIVILLSQIV